MAMILSRIKVNNKVWYDLLMRAASQLPGRGPTDVDDAPAPACYL